MTRDRSYYPFSKIFLNGQNRLFIRLFIVAIFIKISKDKAFRSLFQPFKSIFENGRRNLSLVMDHVKPKPPSGVVNGEILFSEKINELFYGNGC
jgi:hypothetical protein